MQTPDVVEVTTGDNPAGSIIWLHGLGADGHHRRLIQDDALVADENQGIGGAQIYGQVIDQQTAESI